MESEQIRSLKDFVKRRPGRNQAVLFSGGGWGSSIRASLPKNSLLLETTLTPEKRIIPVPFWGLYTGSPTLSGRFKILLWLHKALNGLGSKYGSVQFSDLLIRHEPSRPLSPSGMHLLFTRVRTKHGQAASSFNAPQIREERREKNGPSAETLSNLFQSNWDHLIDTLMDICRATTTPTCDYVNYIVITITNSVVFYSPGRGVDTERAGLCASCCKMLLCNTYQS